MTVDSYVRDGTYASTNYGDAATLRVCRSWSTGANRIAYFNVDTASLTGPVTSAKLRLWCRHTTTQPYAVDVRAVSAPWSESAVTWNNRPALGDVVGSVTLTSSTYRWEEVDVTAYVEAQRQAGQPAMSFALQPSATLHQLAYISSGENAANRPELRLNQ